MNTPIKDRAVHFRLEYDLKTPDAIIAATASHLGLPLVTAEKAFGRVKADLTLIQVSA
jgi:predicted nucleic acid-binding protein